MAASDPYRWRVADFTDFVEKLELPSGGPFVLENFQRLVIEELFTPGRVEVVVLIPKGNAKTTLLAAVGVFHLLVTGNAEVFIGAADTEQANTMFRYAAHFVSSERELERLLFIRKSTREIRSRRDQGFLKVLASDTSAAGGKRTASIRRWRSSTNSTAIRMIICMSRCGRRRSSVTGWSPRSPRPAMTRAPRLGGCAQGCSSSTSTGAPWTTDWSSRTTAPSVPTRTAG